MVNHWLCLFISGAAVSWSKRQQPTVTTSSSDAEYMAANFAGREAMWLRQLLTELGYHIPKLTIYCDSQPAIAVSKNPEHHLLRIEYLSSGCRAEGYLAEVSRGSE